MAYKMAMKPTEAKLIFLIGKMKADKCYAREISRKMSIDYAFLLNTLGTMVSKGWIRKKKTEFSTKAYYELTQEVDETIKEMASSICMGEKRRNREMKIARGQKALATFMVM